MNTKQRFLLAGRIAVVAVGLLLISSCSVDNVPSPDEQRPNAEEEGSFPLPLVVGLVCLVFLIAGGVVLVRYSQKNTKKPGHTNLQHHYRCVECKKKISYSSRRIGQKAECPNCGKSFVFPQAPPQPLTAKKIV